MAELGCVQHCVVSCAALRLQCLSNAEIAKISTRHLGLPSPAYAFFVGGQLRDHRARMEAHGSRLAAANMPRDGWRTQHDALKWRITEDMREMQARATTEVYGLFSACIPQVGRARLDREPARKRQGIVPDFVMYANWDGPERPCLLELKTLHFGASTYRDDARRCEAVARRARALPNEYAAKARAADRNFCATPDGEEGPVIRKLQSFDPVRGLVFGAWGEASPDTERLLTMLARKGASHHWRQMQCQDELAAIGSLAWLLRRRWGMTALRENARLKVERLAFVGRGAAAAALRRQRGEAAHAARARIGGPSHRM